MASNQEMIVVAAVLRFMDQIQKAAEKYSIPVHVLAGLAAQESQGNTWAARPEAHYRWTFGRLASHVPLLKKLLPRWRTMAQDAYMQRISYGLFQVMGAVARELGFKGYLTMLCNPEIGARMGAAKLADCLKRSNGDLRAALLRYNGGGDPAYPDKVFGWAKFFTEENVTRF